MTDQKQETADATTDEAPDFAATLIKIDSGRPHTKISEDFRDVVAAVAKTHKIGKLTVTVTVKPHKDVSGAVIVTATSKPAAPVFDANASIFYATEEGELVRDDPKQHTLY